MKKSIQIIATAFAILLGNVGFSQNDTMYVNYGGNVTIAIPTSQIDSLTFYRPNTTPSITDADGNVYTSVTIGTQEWMSENLRTTKYSDGASIPNVTDGNTFYNLRTGACSDNDSISYNDSIYGKLYNWYAVSDSRNLCPTGWHVPTDAEWTVLTEYLGANGHNGKEGVALKSTSDWDDNGNGTDDYGWNALPSGGRFYNGDFVGIGSNGNWWSSSEKFTNAPSFNYLFSSTVKVHSSISLKHYAFSVRCISD